MKRQLKFVLIGLMIFGCFGMSAPSLTTAAAQKASLKINGASYYGDIKNGKPNGKGTMTWTNSSYDPNDNSYDEDSWITKSYSGDWVDGKRSGQGKYKVQKPYDNFETYTGAWKNDSKNGYGTQIIGSGNPGESNVQMGGFLNNKFVSGYSGFSDATGYVMEYKDSETYLWFILPDQARQFLSGDFRNGSQVFSLFYQKKEKSGVVKGFDYYESVGGAWENFIYEGTYKKVSVERELRSNYLNGTLKQENNITSDGVNYKPVIETYKYSNGKSKLLKTEPFRAGLYSQIEAGIVSHLSVVKPYLGGFTKVFDLMIR